MLNRRTVLLGAAAGGLLAGLPGRTVLAGEQRLVVVTSYPQEMISHYVDAFQTRHPGVRVDVVWLSGHDARDYLLGEGRGKADVFWAPNVPVFLDLARRGDFRPLEIDRKGLPARLGRQEISDPQGRFLATEVAGYGFVFNPARLKAAGLPEPATWDDLAKPAYAGQVVMPDLSVLGFGPTVIEIVLQHKGWTAGWGLLARIAGNGVLETAHGEDLMDLLVHGDKSIGITIDFFADQAIARGVPLKFVYPPANAFEPADIAVLKAAANPRAARQFAAFVLSAAGQSLLINPDLRRLAIRPEVYHSAPPGYFNPWASAFAANLDFDSAVYARRKAVDMALFRTMIADPAARTAPLWAKIRALSARPLPAGAKPLLANAEQALTHPPVDEAEAAPLFEAFRWQDQDAKAVTAVTTVWAARVDQAVKTAAEALRQADLTVKAG